MRNLGGSSHWEWHRGHLDASRTDGLKTKPHFLQRCGIITKRMPLRCTENWTCLRSSRTVRTSIFRILEISSGESGTSVSARSSIILCLLLSPILPIRRQPLYTCGCIYVHGRGTKNNRRYSCPPCSGCAQRRTCCSAGRAFGCGTVSRRRTRG